MSKNTTTEVTVETIEVTLRLLPDTTPELVSVYGAAKVVNPILRELGVNQKDLPPQMFYNYTTARIRTGHNPAMETVQLENGDYRITREGLDAWLVKYIERKGHSVTPVDRTYAFAGTPQAEVAETTEA
jgi:hypothetical protein